MDAIKELVNTVNEYKATKANLNDTSNVVSEQKAIVSMLAKRLPELIELNNSDDNDGLAALFDPNFSIGEIGISYNRNSSVEDFVSRINKAINAKITTMKNTTSKAKEYELFTEAFEVVLDHIF